MIFQVVETGTKDGDEYVTVWDGTRDEKGKRAGIHTFFIPGAMKDFPVERQVQIILKLVPKDESSDASE